MPNAIQLIKQDHRRVTNLFQKYQNTKGQLAKRRVAERAMKQLEIHAKLEEDIFYPAAKRELQEADVIDEAIKEHTAVQDLIEELRRMRLDDEEFDQKWSELVENVQYHVEEEEGEILPEVRGTGIDLSECGTEMKERKEELLAEQSGAGSRS